MEIKHQKTFSGYKVLRIIGYVILGLLAATLFGVAFGYFVMKLWNWLMPAIFGITTISFWQAAGIVLLARLIFGNIGHHGKFDSDDKRNNVSWKDKLHSRSGDHWKYYKEYWDKEGKESFEKYVKEKKEME